MHNTIVIPRREYITLKAFVKMSGSISNAAEVLGMDRRKVSKLLKRGTGCRPDVEAIKTFISTIQADYMAFIVRIVAGACGLQVHDMEMRQTRRQCFSIVEAKQIACYFLTKCTTLNSADIAEKLGYTSKQIVMYNRLKVEEVMIVDKLLHDRIAAIEELLQILGPGESAPTQTQHLA